MSRHDILDLAEACTFEEVAQLLIHDALPTAAEPPAYQISLHTLRGLPQAARETLEAIPAVAHPMDLLRSGVSAMGCALSEAVDRNTPCARDILDGLVAFCVLPAPPRCSGGFRCPCRPSCKPRGRIGGINGPDTRFCPGSSGPDA